MGWRRERNRRDGDSDNRVDGEKKGGQRIITYLLLTSKADQRLKISSFHLISFSGAQVFLI